MRLTFAADTTEEGFDQPQQVIISQQGVEALDDVIELFKQFLLGVGYTYVKQVGVVMDNNDEKWTLR